VSLSPLRERLGTNILTSQQPQADSGLVGGISSITTADLPGGVPEEEMKTAHDHKLGHLASIKKNRDS